MTRKPREPLWATSLAQQPVPEAEWPLPEPEDIEEVPPRSDVRRPAHTRVLAVGALVAVAVGALTAVLAGGSSLKLVEVPSYWGDVPMTCETMRVEQVGRAFEWFLCRAVAGCRLPPGVYRSPDARWTSDLTGRPAYVNEIEISPYGEVTGWAAYR